MSEKHQPPCVAPENLDVVAAIVASAVYASDESMRIGWELLPEGRVALANRRIDYLCRLVELARIRLEHGDPIEQLARFREELATAASAAGIALPAKPA